MKIGLFTAAFIATLVFFILKVTAVIAWSWWLVFLPLIIWATIVVLVLLFVGGLILLAAWAESK